MALSVSRAGLTTSSLFPSVDYSNSSSQYFVLVLTRELTNNSLGSRYQVKINGTVPGPTLYISLGNSVTITVINEIYDDATAIHWHGMSLERQMWNDGVMNLTQCPISNVQGYNSLTYKFTPQHSGTFWYHGHYHSQYPDGKILNIFRLFLTVSLTSLTLT